MKKGRKRNARRHAVPPAPKFSKDVRKVLKGRALSDYIKALRSPQGRKGIRRFKRFMMIPYPPSVKYVNNDGRRKLTYIVNLGSTREAHLATGRKGSKGRRVKIAGRWKVGTDVNGRHLLLASGKRFGKFRLVGYAPETHYEIPDDVALMGSPKRDTHWTHHHHDAGGKWPRVFADTARLGPRTNFIYARGTYSVTDWIRR